MVLNTRNNCSDFYHLKDTIWNWNPNKNKVIIDKKADVSHLSFLIFVVHHTHVQFFSVKSHVKTGLHGHFSLSSAVTNNLEKSQQLFEECVDYNEFTDKYFQVFSKIWQIFLLVPSTRRFGEMIGILSLFSTNFELIFNNVAKLVNAIMIFSNMQGALFVSQKCLTAHGSWIYMPYNG